MSEGYLECDKYGKEDRVRHMLTEVGISVLSGAASTMGATLFLFLCIMIFFRKFGMFIFFVISCSCVYALVLYPALMCVIGPSGNFGDIKHLMGKGKTFSDDNQKKEDPESAPPKAKPQAITPGTGEMAMMGEKGFDTHDS